MCFLFAAMVELLSSLSHIQNRLEHSEHRDELSMLTRLFRNNDFQTAIDLHNQVMSILSCHKDRKPVTTEAENAAREVCFRGASYKSNLIGPLSPNICLTLYFIYYLY